MESELNWILLGLPIAFGLGWLASRLDLRQWRMENRQNPRAYFRGLNFLLNEQQDQAIDAFIEAVQNDPDTSELHFALGNLFRRRGEYERAVRVHEHLLARGDISLADRQRAQHALALDYLKAGLIDRAEDALLKLEGTPFEQEARLARLANYERSRDWSQAAQIARQLDQAGQGSFATRLAHYLCEQASAQPEQALALLEQARETAPHAARPRLELARLQLQAGQALSACAILEDALEAAPSALPLLAAPLAEAAMAADRVPVVLPRLQALYRQSPGIDLLQAIVTLHQASAPGAASARDWYIQHLEQEPSLVAASRWIAGERLEHEQFHPLVQRALDHAVGPLLRYRCAACGFEAKQHFWQCPGCQTWDSYPARRVEEL
ncbi:MAG: lipopolysaccharide assembly protein LapB [Hylemonella sp.]|jgi:lipopolysaccharide biosynthesis regulator YciM